MIYPPQPMYNYTTPGNPNLNNSQMNYNPNNPQQMNPPVNNTPFNNYYPGQPIQNQQNNQYNNEKPLNNSQSMNSTYSQSGNIQNQPNDLGGSCPNPINQNK